MSHTPSSARRLLAAAAAGLLGLALAAPTAGALLPTLDDGGSGYQPGGGYGTDLDTGTEYTPPPPPPADDVPADAPVAGTPTGPGPGPGPAPGLDSPEAPDDPTGEATAAAQDKTSVQLRQETKDALAGARAALANGPCASLLGSTESGETALQILDTLTDPNRAEGKGKIDDDPFTLGKTSDGKPAMAVTEDAGDAGRGAVGKGSGGTIHLFKQFHDLDLSQSPDFYNATASFDGKQYQLTQAEGRIMVVLHELMHLTGALNGDHVAVEHMDQRAVDRVLNGVSAVHERIVADCIPGAKRVDKPAQPGGGTPPRSNDDATPVPGGDGGVGGADDPLPESDLPTVDFDDPHGSDPVITGEDGSELPGGYYSDDPVITGEDGSVIPGGEVGPYPDEPDVPVDPGYGGGDVLGPDWCCDYGGYGGYGGYGDEYWFEAELAY
ncbi:MAG TPA: hypothetical protein VKB57_13045 [Acidimicrobiales bacterium]|nr:hypothetical protein [Acidimicrobiales bacterium]